MSHNQQMPDQYSSSELLHGLNFEGLMRFKNINDKYLTTFLLSFFLKDNEDPKADSMVSAFEDYFAKVPRVKATEFLSSLEKISKDLLDIIRNELIFILNKKQDNSTRQKFRDLDLYQQINTNMISALVDGKKAGQMMTSKLSGFDVISDRTFVGRFFLMNLQAEISNKTLNDQILDNFNISSVKDLVVDCMNKVQNSHLAYLKQIDTHFQKQIARDTSLFDNLTFDDPKKEDDISRNLALMLFFLVGQTTLICLDVMLTTSIPTTSDDSSVSVEESNLDDTKALILNMSRGLLALGIIGCVVGLIPKK